MNALPGQIGQLINLQELDLRGNGLSALPEEIGQLTNLQELYLGVNHLSVLPKEIGRLSNLQVLDLRGNGLSVLPEEIGQLNSLQRLDLSSNDLSVLPEKIGQLTNLQWLDLGDNNLPIPPEILDKFDEPATIISYYLEIMANETHPLNEAKLIFVGQGSVGKTSLVNKLIYDTYNPKENITKGITIEEWEIAVERDEDTQQVHLNVWDFGGQEIMHATHQFFLTKRSVYVLVMDTRLDEEENRLDYWLKIIQSYAGDSPVILVGNKTDQKSFDIDRHGIRKKYKKIRAIVATSCESGRGIDNLRNYIAREVNNLDNVHEPFPSTWFNIKNHLTRMEENYISLQAYREICEKEDVHTERSQHNLLNFLHDLGIIISFQDDSSLMTMGVLNPEWVTNGVYAIINDRETFENHGVLDCSRLPNILDSKNYPKETHLFIVELMKKFNLSESRF